MVSKATIRHSQVSQIVDDSVSAKSRFIIAQPDSSSPTGYRVVNMTAQEYSVYIVNTLKGTGIRDIAVLGDSLSGQGNDNDPMKVNEAWVDDFAIRLDRLELTIVGDYQRDYLPISSGDWFSIRITEDIPVTLDRIQGKINAGTYWINDHISGSLNNKVVHCYVVNNSGNIEFNMSLSLLGEDYGRSYLGSIQLNDSTSLAFQFRPYSRLGLQRLSLTPKGMSVPATEGNAVEQPDYYWLTQMYYK